MEKTIGATESERFAKIGTYELYGVACSFVKDFRCTIATNHMRERRPSDCLVMRQCKNCRAKHPLREAAGAYRSYHVLNSDVLSHQKLGRPEWPGFQTAQ